MTITHKGPNTGDTSEKEDLSEKDEALETEEVYSSKTLNHPNRKNPSEDSKTKLVNLLQMNKDLFAYSLNDMPGIDPNIIQHNLA